MDYQNYAKIECAIRLLKEVEESLSEEAPKEVVLSRLRLQSVVDAVFILK